MIYLLTYDHPHRKTQDLLYQFKMAGLEPRVLATRWIDRKNHVPIFKTKLEPWPWTPSMICEKLGFDYELIESPESLKLNGELVVIGGAGILDATFVNNNNVLNAHCGFLPSVRGLDSLKWAIYYDQPIAVTVHRVDETCDAGKMIERKLVPLFAHDTLFSIAVRQYEMEIEMLVDTVVSKKYLEAKDFDLPPLDPTRRMPPGKELQMMARLQRRLEDLNG